MTPERWREVEELYHAVLERSPEEREVFLRSAETAVRREVESLLEQHGTTLSRPVWQNTPTVELSSISIGTEIGQYRIEGQIGEGGMGVVYRAFDTKLSRPVAIKFLSDELADISARRRFQREAQTASSLNHPHIVTVYDVGEYQGRQYLVTEYIDGGTLKDWSHSEKRTWRQGLDLLTGVADGLATAHGAGMLHRDIKPDNVLITRSGYAKLADFGLAKLAEEPGSEATLTEARTRPGVVIGTIAYMSPEQASGQKLDARSDIFSFGVMLYEILAGHRPFAGKTDLETLQKIVHAAAAPLDENLPLPLRGVIEKALEKNPADRYQSMREMVVDLRRITRQGGQTPAPVQPRRVREWKSIAAAAFVFSLAATAGIWFFTRSSDVLAPRADWVQLTNFSDPVGQPALSPDGRMLTFVRGAGSFITPGQIYVKLLPDGEPKQLTTDALQKMSPVFSPDGSRIAYTTSPPWDTWVVPVLGREPQRWLPNASGLVWSSKGNVLFSEVIDRLEGNHMKIVAAQESRAGERDVYVPSPKGAMAHRSFPSPDGKWAMLAEMSDRGVWLPCRLVPMDSSSSGRPIGPPEAACWFAAWSPDGKWMYVSSNTGGTFHIWRQRFSGSGAPATPEQITFGPTSEEGIAMAPDGRSLITAVGMQQSAVWVHDGDGERQVSLEGYAWQPKFSPDGKALFYLVMKNGYPELWFADLKSGRTESLLPNFPLTNNGISDAYDVSPDGRQVVVQARDSEGKQRLWLAPVNRRTSPRPIPNVEGDGPVFAPDGEVFFRAREGSYGFAYRVREDGSSLRKAIQYPVISTEAVSQDGKWLIVYARYAPPGEEQTAATMAFPLNGGSGFPLCPPPPSNPVAWSADGKLLFLSLASSSYSGTVGKSYIIPLQPGRAWPDVPPKGFQPDAELARLPGVRVLDAPDAVPGPTPEVYAFSRATFQRNLYRIPIR